MIDPSEAATAYPPNAASQASAPTVLVLGGTGFLGTALVRRLRSDGIGLRALVRDSSGRAQALADLGVDVVRGDIADSAALSGALEGIAHVYHLARSSGPTWEDYRRFDVEPTRRLAELCCARGISLYYTSSIAMYDGGGEGDVITESTPPSAAAMRLNVYARAKVANERLLADMHRQQGLKTLVFRPGIVIGSGGSLRPAGVGAWPDASTCRPWGNGRYRLPFVLVDDCADAMARALHVAGIAGQSFNLIGDAPLTGSEYLDALERAAGLEIVRQPLPAWRLFAQSVVKWGARTLMRAPERPLPSYRYCASFSRRAWYSAELAKQRLGWAPVSDRAVLIERGIVLPVTEGQR